MIDISNKFDTLRTATATATLRCSPATLDAIDKQLIPKGNPLEVAKVAAVQGAKDTARIIPYCHNLPILSCKVDWEKGTDFLRVLVEVKTLYKTGVEVEAMTAASIAVLTVYDMCKFMDEVMTIEKVELLQKTGGKSDFKKDRGHGLRAGVLVMSDSISAGQKSDRSGKIIVERLQKEGLSVEQYLVIPDDIATIQQVTQTWADQENLDLIITTGGTGFSPRDFTPEAMQAVFERDIPGIAETMRSYGQVRTPRSMLSRSCSGLRGKSLILCLPGSTKGVYESLDAIIPGIFHSFKMISGGGHP